MGNQVGFIVVVNYVCQDVSIMENQLNFFMGIQRNVIINNWININLVRINQINVILIVIMLNINVFVFQFNIMVMVVQVSVFMMES